MIKRKVSVNFEDQDAVACINEGLRRAVLHSTRWDVVDVSVTDNDLLGRASVLVR